MASESPATGDDRPESGGSDGSATNRVAERSGRPTTDRAAEGSDRPTPDRPAEERPLPPGPNGYPLVGSLVPLMRDPFGFYDELAAYGDVVRYRAARNTFTTLLHPTHVERVLVEDHERFARFEFGDVGLDFAPEGLLSVDGEQWRRQRRVMQPAFTVERIRSYADAMVDQAERAGDEWADGEELALNRRFSELTLRILSKALFDLEVDPTKDAEPIARAARAINERSGPERNLTMLLPDWVPTPANRRYERAIRDYRERVDELIERRRNEENAGEDLLSILLHAEGPGGETLSDAEVRDNALTFAFAGHETTALGLTYAFMLLAEHDDIAERLRAEFDAVLDGERPRFEHVPHLAYTGAVVDEALRLYPPAFILFRRAAEDVVVGGYRIPEGTVLTLPQFRIHRDERFYDEPDAFRPERWLEDHDRPEYAFFPFGGGPRHCIGMRFATLEMKLVLATLLWRFDVELLSDPDPDPTAGATLQPAEDVRVRIRER